MDQQANRLERRQFNGATWALTSMPFAGGGTTKRRITLSPDGTLLLKASGDGSLLTRIDTATFAILPGSDDATPIGSTALNRIAFANDGTAIGNSAGATTLYRYDMLTRQFVTLGTDSNLQNRHIAASTDGDTLVLTSDPLSTGGSILTYDASNGTLTERTAGNATTSGSDNEKVTISRDGSRILLLSPESSGGGNRPVVYDASFAVLGRLPVGLNGFVLKPDGSAAYGYYPGTTSVRKFDLTVPPDGSGIFPELGSATVVASPGTSSTAMTMSPDGSALFLAGDQQVIVLPAP
jgi:WD40 repeat protein